MSNYKLPQGTTFWTMYKLGILTMLAVAALHQGPIGEKIVIILFSIFSWIGLILVGGYA